MEARRKRAQLGRNAAVAGVNSERIETLDAIKAANEAALASLLTSKDEDIRVYGRLLATGITETISKWITAEMTIDLNRGAAVLFALLRLTSLNLANILMDFERHEQTQAALIRYFEKLLAHDLQVIQKKTAALIPEDARAF